MNVEKKIRRDHAILKRIEEVISENHHFENEDVREEFKTYLKLSAFDENFVNHVSRAFWETLIVVFAAAAVVGYFHIGEITFFWSFDLLRDWFMIMLGTAIIRLLFSLRTLTNYGTEVTFAFLDIQLSLLRQSKDHE